MSKIYMITGKDTIGAIYYVAADAKEDAEDYLREQIRKYFFKAKLSNKHDFESIYMIGNRILVDGFLTEGFAGADYDITDVTPMAYVNKMARKEYWVDLDVERNDCIDWKIDA